MPSAHGRKRKSSEAVEGRSDPHLAFSPSGCNVGWRRGGRQRRGAEGSPGESKRRWAGGRKRGVEVDNSQ